MAGPISLADAKAWLRVDDDFEDAVIQQLIDTAARHIENVYGVVAAEQTRTFLFDGFSAEMRLPRNPVDTASVTVAYYDLNGTPLSFTGARAVERDGWSWLFPPIGEVWPKCALVPGAVEVTATVGYVNDAVPDDIKQATRLLIDHWFTTRDYSCQPDSIDFLIDHYRFRRV